MSAPANLDDYLDLIRKSAVTDDKRLEQYVQKLRTAGMLPAEPGKLAGLMVHDGLLTHFQAEQLLLGRWRRFTIGKYKVLERLGSGGMGLVYLCEHKMMRRRVAVKVLPSAKAKDPASLERFKREARAAAVLDHPNIVHAYDIDHDEELHFLVMEYVEGASFQDIIQKSGPMDVVRACHYIRQAAQGIEHAHQKGLVHRDIKPGNILVDRAGTVKILDMGLARFFNDEDDVLTKKYDENMLGTGDYMSPEQIEDSHGVDTRADIYSLGATFYYMLTGKPPFGDGKAHQKLTWVLTKQPKPVTAHRPEVPEKISEIILKMMAKKPADRYQNLDMVAEALAPFTQTPIPPPPDSEMPVLSVAVAGLSGEMAATTVSRGPGSMGTTPTPLRTAANLPAAITSAGSSIQWESLANETANPTALADTTPQQRRTSSLEGKERQSNRKLIIIASLLFVGILATVGILYLIFRKGEPDPVPPPRGPLQVSANKGYRTIALALKEAKSGDTIELADELHRETLMVSPRLKFPTDITIQAKHGTKVIWRPSSEDASTPLLHLQSAKNFRLKGHNLTLDGTINENRKVEILIKIEFSCPGLVLEEATLKSFTKRGIAFTNCAGFKGQEIRLNKLIFSDEPKTEAAVYFDAFEGIDPAKNNHIVIEGCKFSDGFGENPIARKNEDVTDDAITIPGKWK